MKADSQRQARLLDLQAIDTRLAQIAHARTTLPQHAELADLEGKARLLDDQLIRSRTELGDVQREAHNAYPDLEQVNIHLTWTPFWNPDMMSDDAKDELGIF